MPYITREDGERFIIPSYRDVLSAKKPSLLKREVLLLTANYGEYITLQRKNVEQYEVAFSPDPGYLLGESIWHYFKRPFDLIYCEAIPNTTEAILVIVKSGSVYLDGSFPIDSIPEELVIFRTQQNNFDIYIYGDVPISKTQEEGKFFLDPSSVRSFNILPNPVFPTLPKIKSFQLQPVDVVLEAQGIGVFPIRKILIAAAIVFGLWILYTFLTTHKKELPTSFISVVNPYQVYLETMASPDPVKVLDQVNTIIVSTFTIPGWYVDSIDLNRTKLIANVKSLGAKTPVLFDWATKNRAKVLIQSDGFHLIWDLSFPNRPVPDTIQSLNDVIAKVVDRMEDIIPGNPLQVGNFIDKKAYVETALTINFSSITPTIFDLMIKQLKDLPLVLTKLSIKIDTDKGLLTGTIGFQTLGY
jgi:hypothetical protein